MAIEVRPATRFADMATMLGPKRDPDASVCWCLSHRVDSRTNGRWSGRGRGFEKVADTRSVPTGSRAWS
jgi:hypothetical protein